MPSALQSFIALYENLSSDSLARLSEVYSTDVEFIDPITHCKGLTSLNHYLTKSMQDVQQCNFAIEPPIASPPASGEVEVAVTWVMQAKTVSGKQLKLDGCSHLRINADRIVYHRDYYDMGQLVYEQVPLLSSIIRAIKRRLA